MTTEVRILQKSSSSKSWLLSLPKDETGWDVGDVVRYKIIDDNTIVLKKLRE